MSAHPSIDAVMGKLAGLLLPGSFKNLNLKSIEEVPKWAIVAALATGFVSYKLISRLPCDGIPKVTERLPIVGAAMEYGKDPREYLLKQKRKHGNLFRINLIAFEPVFVLDHKDQEKLLKASNSTADFDEAIEKIVGILQPPKEAQDKEWNAKSHPMIIKGFMRAERLEYTSAIVQKTINEFCSEWASRDQIELFHEASRMILTINMRTVLGEDVAATHAHLIPHYQAMEDLISHPMTNAFLTRLNPWYRKCWDHHHTLVVAMRAECDKRINADGSAKEEFKGRQDYLQMVLNEFGGRYNHVLPYHIVGILLAAHTNTAGHFAWTLANIVASPKILSAVREGALSHERNEYLEACVRETGRIYTGFLFNRLLKEDMVMEDGRVLKKGTFTAMSNMTTNFDEQLFPNPYKYDPTRYLNAPATLLRSPIYLQFGTGPHKCLGERFAHQVLRSGLTTFVNNFEAEYVEAVKDGDGNVRVPPLSWRRMLGTMWSEEGVWVRVSRRA
ncbi:hypothetical protein HK097_007859 [Rhizophlyctis rosea]|uniref:Cytochrome P450 n=1 Tax=Rhizophlyctis rosea TaxID=64517 RepID=A0AAD5SDA4_9FUNG|nr:hypothetical protein HK097_007859 [Rhizophlyctis rosea]